MIKIDIDSTPSQEFSVSFEGELIRIVLDYRLSTWLMNVSYKSKSVNGLKLASSVLMLQGKNFPFDILIDDKGLEIDPFQLDSFSNGAFDFLLLERSDVEGIRGFKVE